MAEYTNNDVQLVQPGQPVLLNTTIGCNKGYVIHREGSGILTLRGIVNCANACFARYQVTFNGNVAIPDGGDITPVAIAITVQGEPRLTSRAIYTPQAVGEYGNLTSTAIITVPRGCCMTVAVDYVDATTDDPTVTPTPLIEVQNANLTITRIA